MRKLLVVTSLVFVVLRSGAAFADKNSDDAKRLFQEGTNAYNLGEFNDAIEKYKAAYKLLPQPVFLYNIAQAYRLANDLPQALFFYKSYLRSAPEAANRTEVEGRIADLEKQLAKLKETANAPPNNVVGPANDPTTGPTTGNPTTEPVDDGSGDGDTKIPDPSDTGDESDVGRENQTPPTSGPGDTGGSGKKPIYKKWWFWAGIGAVAVGTVVIIAATSGSDGGGAPESDFGTSKVF